MKLIFTWPSTVKNVEVVASLGASLDDYALLEEGQVAMLRPGCSLLLPPCMLHYVVNLMPSISIGINFECAASAEAACGLWRSLHALDASTRASFLKAHKALALKARPEIKDLMKKLEAADILNAKNRKRPRMQPDAVSGLMSLNKQPSLAAASGSTAASSSSTPAAPSAAAQPGFQPTRWEALQSTHLSILVSRLKVVCPS